MLFTLFLSFVMQFHSEGTHLHPIIVCSSRTHGHSAGAGHQSAPHSQFAACLAWRVIPHWLQQLAASPRALLASPVLGKGGPRAEPTAGGWRWQCREPPRAEVGPERFGQFLCRVYFGFCCCSADKQMASQSITALGYYFVSMQMILLCCTVWLFTANC